MRWFVTVSGMGRKLQYSRYLFIKLLNRNCDAASVVVLKSQDTWINFKNSFLKVLIGLVLSIIQLSMDKLFEQNNRERVRNTMLRQEEIFKQQVQELHRLHRVQKMLMADLRTKEANFHSVASANIPTAVKDTKSRHWSRTSTSETSHSTYINNRPRSIPYINSEYNSIHQYSVQEYPRKQRGFDLVQPVKQDPSISLDCLKEELADEECNVELTLSVRCSSSKKKSDHWLQPERSSSGTRQKPVSTIPARPERGEECSEREGLQRPPWLFQAMSLN